MISCYEEAVRTIENSSRFLSVNPVEYTAGRLDELGNPDRRAGMLVHIAGTNGKGSVSAYLASIFRGMGLRTGHFTSPHLVRLNERIAVDGQMISDGDFFDAFKEVRGPGSGGEPGSGYFETLFLMAMVYFAKMRTDVAVIETGLGGRLDATNAVRDPAVTVITQIGFDHMGILGNSIEEIAAEKAGILKAGAPCVYSAENPKAAAVIEKRARDLGGESPSAEIRLYPLSPEDCLVRRMGSGVIDFSTSFRYDRNADYKVRSFAPYQAENASLAVLAVKALADRGLLRPSADEVKRGLYEMEWPARMEEIAPRVFLDGAHNIDGIRRFLEAARAVAGGGRARLLFSAVNDKDYGEMIRELSAGYPWEKVITTEIKGVRQIECGALKELFERAGTHAESIPGIREALLLALRDRDDGTYVFICGSLYLAGTIKEIMK